MHHTWENPHVGLPAELSVLPHQARDGAQFALFFRSRTAGLHCVTKLGGSGSSPDTS